MPSVHLLLSTPLICYFQLLSVASSIGSGLKGCEASFASSSSFVSSSNVPGISAKTATRIPSPLWTNHHHRHRHLVHHRPPSGPVFAKVIGDAPSKDDPLKKDDVKTDKQEKRGFQFLPPPPKAPLLAFPKERRRRKLVDRSNVFTDALPDFTPSPPPANNYDPPLPFELDYSPSSSPSDSSSQTQSTKKAIPWQEFQFQEELFDEELCYLDDFTTSEGQTCFVSNPSSPLQKVTSSSRYNFGNSNSNSNFNPKNSNNSSEIPLPTESIPPIIIESLLQYLPIIMPLFAFLTYETTAKSFDKFVEFISNNNWVAVDGGQYQANIITPAINGLVVPSIALLFATLVSNTINTLRQRQLQIRTNLNTEANDLRMLSTMVDSLPEELHRVKNHLREYLIQYASRIIAESKPGLSVESSMFIGSMDHELNGFLGVLNKLSMCSYGTVYLNTMQPGDVGGGGGEKADDDDFMEEDDETTATTKESSMPSPPPSTTAMLPVPYPINESNFQNFETQLGLTPYQRHQASPFLSSPIFSESYDALTRLRNERSTRLSALQSTYPTLHYVLLGLLASSICVVFLMETNQELLIFLSAIQLKILWGMLIGTFSALGVVNYDMRDPFRGSYNVAVSVDQFYTIRESIRATIQMEQERIQRKEIGKLKSVDAAKR